MINFVLPTPSLQHLAAVKIVAHVSSQSDNFTQIARSFFDQSVSILEIEEEELIEAMEEKAKSNVLTLLLPDPCIKQLLNLIKPIGREIVNWCRYNILEYDRFQFLDLLLFNQLRWTMHGNVDYAKTAELMVKDDRFDVERRYEMACFNCLEDEARQLFGSMGQAQRQEYFNKEIKDNQPLIAYFTCTLSGDADHTLTRHFHRVRSGESINQRLFVDTLRWGTRATCEYFFTKLNPEEKERVLGACERGECYIEQIPTCSFLYYLSLLDEERRRSLFDECAVEVLLVLLHWPMQSLFVEVIRKCGWSSSMDERDCSVVFCAIADKIGSEDYDYAQLFWECWRLISIPAKRFHLSDRPLLIKLLNTGRAEFVRLIREKAPVDMIFELSRYYPELEEEEESSDESDASSEAAVMESSSDGEDDCI